MPLFYQHNINGNTCLAVWKITENEDFFLEKVPLQRLVTHPHKRLQHLAGRYLLEILRPGFPFEKIAVTPSKKPILTNGDIHFSISHCGDFAAAIVSDNAAVGIDVETISSKILNVKQRFLSEPELQLVEKIKSQFAEEAIITLFWSAKECVFKWYGKGHLSFKNNMRLKQIIAEKPGIYIDAQFIRNETTQLKIYFHFLDTLCLAWLMA